MSEFVKGLDATGVPVTLTLKNQGVHQTLVGGCCSLIVLLLTLTIMTAEWGTVFFGYQFSNSIETEFILETDNGDDPF